MRDERTVLVWLTRAAEVLVRAAALAGPLVIVVVVSIVLGAGAGV